MTTPRVVLVAVASIALSALSLHSASIACAGDIPKSEDHSIVSRFPGSEATRSRILTNTVSPRRATTRPPRMSKVA